jgi:hypothetical protein
MQVRRRTLGSLTFGVEDDPARAWSVKSRLEPAAYCPICPVTDFLDSNDCAADTSSTATGRSATLHSFHAPAVTQLCLGGIMKRLSMVLALAVWTASGCASCFAEETLFGCIHNCLFGSSRACGDSVGCGDSCGCGETGCCDTCNSGGRGCCASGCGCEQGGICDCIVSDCPVCQGARNCGLFRRYCGPGCGDGCDCGMRNDYDCSACRLGGCCYGYGLANRGCGCGGGGCGDGSCGGGCGCGPRAYGGCNAPYGNGCCAGPGCCASGDQHYTFNPGPPVGQTAYPYYTTRGPRDFLEKNPAPIGPY